MMPFSRRQFLWAAGSSAGLAFIPALQAGSTVKIVEFDSSGHSTGTVEVEKIVKKDSEWRKQLTDEQFDVTRHEGTERPFTGKYAKNHDAGIYRCGWPSFWAPIAKENVREKVDHSFGATRTEVKCTRCDAHLGHVFDDGPKPTGLRYCMNSAAMNFEAKAKG
jgi:peptide-methionine (R)-S-oxide reductase